jgi:5'-3' exoribonuclease 1
MGIPAYFSYIIRNYPTIIQKHISQHVDNLYLDCNSIIYDVYNKLVGEHETTPVHIQTIEHRIILDVLTKIEEYISVVRPSKTVIIAFDGVAPVAKLNQQRARRYKSWYQNEVSKSIHNKYGKKEKIYWNTNAITPGTAFMKDLNSRVYGHFNGIDFKPLDIYVSGADIPGEGEHKLFDFIRTNPEKHLTETTYIYGIDSDLIMLSINHLHVCPNIYLFRETPHFIQSIDSLLEPDQNYIMDIRELSNAIVMYMNNEEEDENKKQEKGLNNNDDDNEDKEHVSNKKRTEEEERNKVYDYIFLCFFLGNDFLPHFPALNIRTDGIEKLMNAYKETIGKTNKSLTNGKEIYWKQVRKLIEYLVPLEEGYIQKEHRSRNYKYSPKQIQNQFKKPVQTIEDEFKLFDSTPTQEREIEYYINPLKPYWQYRYYQALVRIDARDNKREICMNYLEGLEWTMKYYTIGCPDWRWRYKYTYPPLLQDLVRYIPAFERTLVPYQPVNPVTETVQLCYVLPRKSLDLLPEKLRTVLLTHHEDWYNENCEFLWAYCKYFWESHVEMTEIDIGDLERFIEEKYPGPTKKETKTNSKPNSKTKQSKHKH